MSKDEIFCLRLKCSASVSAAGAYQSDVSCDLSEQQTSETATVEELLAQMVKTVCRSIVQSCPDGCFYEDEFLMYLLMKMEGVSPIFTALGKKAHDLLQNGVCVSDIHKHLSLSVLDKETEDSPS